MADVKTASALPPQPTAPGGPRKRRLWRPMIIMIVVVLVIVAIIAGVKFTQISALIAQSKQPLPAAVVTALKVPVVDRHLQGRYHGGGQGLFRLGDQG